METILSRIPDQSDIWAWAYRHRGKLLGFLCGSLGTWVVTTFLVVAITGIPIQGVQPDPDRFIVYPNF